MKTLKELIGSRSFYYVKSGMSVLDVAKIMDKYNVGAVPVLSNEYKLAGVFSERDLLRRCISKEIDMKNTPVDEVMTKNVIVIEAHDTPEYCLQILKQENIRHIPVIEGTELMGFLSIRDLMTYDMHEKEEKIEMLNAYIQFNG